MRAGTLHFLWSAEDRLRSPALVGFFKHLPRYGEAFEIYGDGQTVIKTATVIHVQNLEDGMVRFFTGNCVYDLEPKGT